MDLHSEVSNVNSKEGLSKFVESLAKELSENPDSWENADLPSFLEAMAAWIEDMDGYYSNTKQEFNSLQPTWKNFADILIASTMYE